MVRDSPNGSPRFGEDGSTRRFPCLDRIEAKIRITFARPRACAGAVRPRERLGNVPSIDAVARHREAMCCPAPGGGQLGHDRLARCWCRGLPRPSGAAAPLPAPAGLFFCRRLRSHGAMPDNTLTKISQSVFADGLSLLGIPVATLQTNKPAGPLAGFWPPAPGTLPGMAQKAN